MIHHRIENSGWISLDSRSIKTPLEVCVALSQAAIERFQHQAGLALNYWKLRQGIDLGAVLSWLIQSCVLTVTGDGKEKLLGGLSTMQGPLVVEADRIAAPERLPD
jgi:hypothetical protein